MKLNYRPDIDGLRAVAVTLTILYHAYPESVKKGFIGVDMFFVISGYLITSIILREGYEGTFSLINFYARRFKRILPAFFTIIIASLLLGYMFLPQEELNSLLKHSAASLFFIQNFNLYFEVDYFDRAAELKPLLHLWSLAVEEQFYLFYPLLLMLFIKRKNLLIIVLCALIAISFVYALKLNTSGDKALAFYMLPSRFWELGLGGVVAWLNLNYASQLDKIRNNTTIEFISALAFIILIIAAMGVIIDANQAIYSVLPCFILILIGEKSFISKRILSSRLLVALGLISYPLYLWHWSLFSIIRLYEVSLLIFLAIILSALTYHFVEKPVKHINFPDLKLVRIALMSLIAPTLVLVIFAKYDIQKEVTDVNVYNEQTYKPFCPYKGLGLFCAANFKENQPHTVLWGDSHAAHFYAGLADEEAPISLITSSSCRPLLQSEPYIGASRCKDINIKAFKFIASNTTIKNVILSLYQNQAYILHKNEFVSKDAFYKRFYHDHKTTIEALLKAGKGVAIIYDAPVLNTDPFHCDKRSLFLIPPSCSISRLNFNEKSNDYNTLLLRLKSEFPQIKILDPTSQFCDDNVCKAKLNGFLLYRDDNHLSLLGSRLAAKNLQER